MTGSEKQQFDEAFLSAFNSYAQLQRMLDYIDIDLNSFSNSMRSMPDIVADIRDYGVRQNYLDKIIAGALDEVPGNLKLKALVGVIKDQLKSDKKFHNSKYNEINVTGNGNIVVPDATGNVWISVNQNNSSKDVSQKHTEQGGIRKDIYRIFISYSSKDRELREFFESELKDYLHSSAYSFEPVWSDAEITTGDDWNEIIQTALDNSDIGILLVSPKLLSSKYAMADEFTDMLRRRETEGYLILPVLLRDTIFKNRPDLAAMQFFKTYQSEYDITAPLLKNKLMPFDELYARADDRLFNRYFNKFIDQIDKAIEKKANF
jgi:hypothetical protein